MESKQTTKEAAMDKASNIKAGRYFKSTDNEMYARLRREGEFRTMEQAGAWLAEIDPDMYERAVSA